jgi:hypothetical protein
MFAAAALSFFGLGFLIWVLFNLAVHALPVFVAVGAGQWALRSGAGPAGAVITAFFAGAIALVVGQIAFASVRAPPVRLALGAFYALPAGVAGFTAVRALSEFGGAIAPWTLVFASIGGLGIGATAWVRIAALSGPVDAPAPSIAAVVGGPSDAWLTRPSSQRHPSTIKR